MAKPTVRPFCLAPHCVTRARHRDDCPDVDECRGCLPRLAADGLRLCDVCARQLGENLMVAAIRYTDLGLVLTAGRGLGEIVTASTDPNMSLNEHAADLRAEIRRALAGVCGLISRERGMAPPALAGVVERVENLPRGFIGPPRMLIRSVDEVAELSVYAGRHREWLAAHSRAGRVSARLHDLAHGDAYRVAYPSGGRSFEVATPNGPAPCPETVDGKPCAGTLWTILRRTDSLWPAELACNVDDGHRIPFADWLRHAQRMRRRAGIRDEPAPAQ